MSHHHLPTFQPIDKQQLATLIKKIIEWTIFKLGAVTNTLLHLTGAAAADDCGVVISNLCNWEYTGSFYHGIRVILL